MARDKSSSFNFEVDYVISYRFKDTDRSKAPADLEKLIQALASVGLEIELRNGDDASLLIFTKAGSSKRFNQEIYKARVKDWLVGVRTAQPDKDVDAALAAEPLTDAERYRLVHHLITTPKTEGGAGITPKSEEWKGVESIFPLHDPAFNKAWIRKWSSQTFLQPEDLDEIRDHLGEKIAFYFAFTQSYFTFLVFPAAFGFAAWVLLSNFSPVVAVANMLWCVTFVEYWKKQEVDLAHRWGVAGVSAIQSKRKDFKHEKEAVDPVTGETVFVFPSTKRLSRQLLQVPFAILASLALGTLIATCFGIEIFLSEVYNGPLQGVLVFLPTGLLTVFVPTLTALLTNIATQLNDFENWDTQEGYETSMTGKVFILNFITSYLPIFLTAFVYVPFGSLLVPYLDVFSLTARPFASSDAQLQVPQSGFEINPARLRKQVIYFTVTAQVVNLAMETVVPYLKRRGTHKFQDYKSELQARTTGVAPPAGANDVQEEAAFLARVRHEAELDSYDVTTDLREMVVQFGYLALFSVVWPLVPVSFIVNNWIELRSDAVKICIEMQRPTPHRADGIGPWLDSLAFLTWLGSLSTAALVHLFSNDGLGPDGTPATIQGWALLLAIFCSEHVYLLVRLGVRVAVGKLDSPGLQRARAEKGLLRKKVLEDAFGEELGVGDVSIGVGEEELISRATLEEDARMGSLRESRPEERFWARQRGWRESVHVGRELMERAGLGEGEGGKKGQ